MPLSRRTFLAAGSAAAAMSAATPTLLKAAQGTSDAQYVFDTLSAIHPGLFRYQSPALFAERHAAFARAFESGSFDQKIIALQRLLGAVRCGHTYINPSNQSAAIQEQLYGTRRLLPFHFQWIGSDMIVTADPHAAGIAPGTQISSIDGRAASDILSALLPFARADGGNDAKRRALMSMPGTNTWPMFDLYYDLLFRPAREIVVTGMDPEGDPVSLTLETIDIEARRSGGTLKVDGDPEAPIWFSDRANDGRTRIITMPTWATYKTRWDWEGWLRAELGSALSDGTTGLIFDLRGNEGGFNIGEGMLPFLIREPLSVPSPSQQVRFAQAPEELRPLFNTWDPTFYEIGKSGERVSERFIEISPSRNVDIQPAGPGFGGKIAVLIDADNSSATFDFSRQLRSSGIATLVGEPTGGNLRGINGGAYFFTVLPESGIEFDIPLIGYFPDGEQPDAGLEPDEIVTRTPQAIADGSDPAMDRALALVS